MKANDHGYCRKTVNGRRDYEHRMVWESENGPIPQGYHIHHRNGDTSDNRIENLELLDQSAHRLAHSTVRSADGRKRCTICKCLKQVDQFAKCKGGSPQGPCRPCKAEYNRRYSKSRKS